MTSMNCRRGELRIIGTQVLFINDDETGSIEIHEGNARLAIQINLKPSGGAKVLHPDVMVDALSAGVRLTFVSWDQPLVYLALEPIEIGHLGEESVFMAVTNTYLDKTNRLEIQFYAR